MKEQEADSWKDNVLDEIFAAIAANEILTKALIFKGARVLARYLPESARQSLDLDSNTTREFIERYPERKALAAVIEQELTTAIRRHFESQSPVTYELSAIRVMPKPPREHPHGWNALEVRLRVADLRRQSQGGIPSLQLDIAAPEELTGESVTQMVVAGHKVQAYTLERITGEKLRAFLSSAPEHQAKTHRTGILRAKDLYDLARIANEVPVNNTRFWQKVGIEFHTACKSRGVDCAGWSTFAAIETLARGLYEKESVLPKNIPFDKAWIALNSIVERLERAGVTPFTNPLPPVDNDGAEDLDFNRRN